MTLLNIANDGLPNILTVLCKAVSSEGPIDQEKLVDVCSIREENSERRIRDTIRRWTKLGLFLENDGKIIFVPIAAEKFKACKTPEAVTKVLPSIVRELIFDEENNNNFWDREESRASDLSRALAWILAQDIYKLFLKTHRESEGLEAQQVNDPEKRIMQNDVRFNGLRFWAQFLGFTWASKEMMIDPTQAIREECREVFEKGRNYQASEFVQSLAAKIPVLDGGIYRQRVEDILDPQYWQKPSTEQMLSTSLSRALWRLELAGIIELESRADAHSNRVIQRQHGHELRSFTHVVYRGEE